MRVRAKQDVHDHVVDELSHLCLTPGAEYLVVGLCDEYFRVVDDLGDPMLYPRQLFEILDSTIPSDWVCDRDEDGYTYIDPPECARPGFYEDVADRRSAALATFARVLERLRREVALSEGKQE
jgi:hypothetical protein